MVVDDMAILPSIVDEADEDAVSYALTVCADDHCLQQVLESGGIPKLLFDYATEKCCAVCRQAARRGLMFERKELYTSFYLKATGQ